MLRSLAMRVGAATAPRFVAALAQQRHAQHRQIMASAASLSAAKRRPDVSAAAVKRRTKKTEVAGEGEGLNKDQVREAESSEKPRQESSSKYECPRDPQAAAPRARGGRLCDPAHTRGDEDATYDFGETLCFVH